MPTTTILFQKNKPMLEREDIVEQIIKACESFEFDKIVLLVKDEANFDLKGQNVFLAEMKSIFKRAKTKKIKEVIPSVSFCNLCFFKEEIVTFSTSGNKPQFALMFNTDDGYVKDISIDRVIE